MRYGLDTKANATHFLAVALWLLGYPEQALARCNELSEFWPDTPFLYNRIWRSVSLIQLAIWLKQPHIGHAQIEADIALCNEQGFSFISVVLRTLRGALRIQKGEIEAGLHDIEDGIAVHRASGTWFSLPMFHLFRANAFLHTHQVEKGVSAVAEGLAVAQQGGDHRFDAELYRVRGELSLTGTRVASGEAEAEFRTALKIASAQEAKSLELRAATSIARLLQSQAKRKEAHDVLSPIYNWFTEGFDTRDLREAKALLEELG
jgi:predicted ATPase